MAASGTNHMAHVGGFAAGAVAIATEASALTGMDRLAFPLARDQPAEEEILQAAWVRRAPLVRSSTH